jgi:hypothetical protein
MESSKVRNGIGRERIEAASGQGTRIAVRELFDGQVPTLRHAPLPLFRIRGWERAGEAPRKSTEENGRNTFRMSDVIRV